MNNEIKEMTKVLKSLGNKQASELYYYITNLQQENERLKEENKYLDELRNANYSSWQDSLSRIEKAVEYIKEHNMIVVNKEYIPDGISTAYDYELMNILNGRSDE